MKVGDIFKSASFGDVELASLEAKSPWVVVTLRLKDQDGVLIAGVFEPTNVPDLAMYSPEQLDALVDYLDTVGGEDAE